MWPNALAEHYRTKTVLASFPGGGGTAAIAAVVRGGSPFAIEPEVSTIITSREGPSTVGELRKVGCSGGKAPRE